MNSEYIAGIDIFPVVATLRTLEPFLHKGKQFNQARYEEVSAVAGYEGEENCLYLEFTGQACFIKPTNYDQKKRARIFTGL